MTTYSYLDSDSVTLFPSGFRGSNFNEAKLTTEENLITLRYLSSNKDNNNQFFEDPIDSDYVILVLAGYYFRFAKTNTGIPNEANLYACIKLRDTETNIGKVLANINQPGNFTLDDVGGSASKFYGLGFSTFNTAPPNSIKVRDENKNLIYQKLHLDSAEIRDSAATDNQNKNITQQFTTDVLKTKQITRADPNQKLIIDNDLKMSLSNGADIDVKINEPVTINKEISIDAPLEIGDETHNSKIKITTSTNAAAELILSGGKTLKLPGNSNSGNAIKEVLTNNIDGQKTPGWVTYSSNKNAANTLVQKDSNSGISAETFNGVQINKNSQAGIRITSGSNAATIAADGVIQIDAEGKLQVGAKGATNSDTPEIEIADKFLANQEVSITAPLSIQGEGPISLQSSNSGASELILQGNKSLKLPGNAPLSSNLTASLQGKVDGHVLMQDINQGSPNWVPYTSQPGIPECLVMTDASGNINAQVAGVIDTASSVMHNLINSTDTSVGIMHAGNNSSGARAVNFTDKATINPKTGAISVTKINGIGITSGNNTLTLTKDSTTLKVTKSTAINAPLNIGESNSSNAAVTIKSSGANATTIVGPNNGIINLPPNSQNASVLFANQTAGNPSWIPYSTNFEGSTIVKRDTEGNINAKNFYMFRTSYGMPNGACIGTGGQIQEIDFSYLDNSVQDIINTGVITNISQGATGQIYGIQKAKITPAAIGLTAATRTKLGLVKSMTTGTVSGRDYNVEVAADGTMKVNVPWINSDTTYAAATTSTLGLVKPKNIRNSSISAATGQTASSKYYGVELDSNNQMFVDVPWENTTYSTATSSTNGLMHKSDKEKLDKIEDNAQANVKANWSETNSFSDAYILNKPTIGNATISIKRAYDGGSSLIQSFTTNATRNVDVVIPLATTTSSGLMSYKDKKSLANLTKVCINGEYYTASFSKGVLSFTYAYS